MEFRHLRYFLVLAEELHFGRAAHRLGLSQPPLSLNIQQLEASVGARLFTRSSKAVALTAAGLAFVPAARALLEQSTQAANLASDVGRGMVGSLGERIVVASPLYKQHFDLQTGECLEAPEHSVACYPAKIEGGQVWVGA